MKRMFARSALVASIVLGPLTARNAAAQDDIPVVTYPAVPTAATALTGFVPAGWKLEAQATGDLTGDGAADIVLVLRDQDPGNVLRNSGEGFDTNPRILVIALADGHGGYRLVAANHTLISRRDNPDQDDNFQTVSIARGALQVKLQSFMNAGGWSVYNYTFTFKLQKDAISLIGYDLYELNRASMEVEELSVNYASARYSTAKGTGDIDKHTVRWRHLPVGTQPPTLEQIKDGMEFQPPGVPDVY